MDVIPTTGKYKNGKSTRVRGKIANTYLSTVKKIPSHTLFTLTLSMDPGTK